MFSGTVPRRLGERSQGFILTNLPLSNIDTFENVIQKAFASRRLEMLVVSLFSGAALVLAALGLYGFCLIP